MSSGATTTLSKKDSVPWRIAASVEEATWECTGKAVIGDENVCFSRSYEGKEFYETLDLL